MNLYAPLGYLDRKANEVENWMARKPVLKWMTYQKLGDPASWIFSHNYFVLIGAVIGAGLGAAGMALWGIVGWRLGALYGARVVVAIYCVREPVDGRRKFRAVGRPGLFVRMPESERHDGGLRVGLVPDGFGDVLGPYLFQKLIRRILF